MQSRTWSAATAAAMLLMVAGTARAQSAPTLVTSGTVEVGLAAGRMGGHICLAGRPEGFRDAFSLNAGLNVARVTDGAGKPLDFDGWYDPGVDGEARVYTVTTPAATLCVDYVGAFPVYPAHDAPLDFKGVIAFDGASVRATEQAAWLPLPYDRKRKARLDTTRYDLAVSCAECAFIYVNGNDPVTAVSGKFASARARPAMLFAGTGPLARDASVTIINETVSAPQAAALVDAFRQIEAYYATYLGQQIRDTPAIVRVLALDQQARDRTGSEWGFATWPTIALSGSIRPIADALIAGGEGRERRLGYLAHEIGHYYFGTLVNPTGRYRWFLVETMAEFLSLKARGALAGPAAEQRRVADLAGDLARDTTSFVPLDQIRDSEQIGDLYRYNYGPLLLIALERQVGERRMAAFVRMLLSSPVDSWQEFGAVAERAGIARAEWNAWYDRCVRGATRACVTAAS